MKKIFGIIMAMAIFCFGGSASAEFPTKGNFIVATGVGTDPRVTSVNESGATVEFPVFNSQIEEEGVSPTDFTMYGSISYWDASADNWVLIPQEKYEQYAMETTAAGDKLKVNVVFPDVKLSSGEKANFFWIRFWGNNDSDQEKWLWVNQSSNYMRLDKKGKPGYEVVFNRTTGEYQTPQNYDVRP